MRKEKTMYLIKESDDGFESSEVIGTFDNFDLACAAIEELKTYTKFADNGKRYVMESYKVLDSITDIGKPMGRPTSVFFGYTTDCDLYGDFSFMNGNKKWPAAMLVVDIPSNYHFKIENDVFIVVKVPVFINDSPDDVKDRGSEIANIVLNELKTGDLNINLLRTADSNYLNSEGFSRLHEIEFNNNKAFMLEVK